MKRGKRAGIISCALIVGCLIWPREILLAKEGGRDAEHGQTWVQKETLELSGQTYTFTLRNDLDYILSCRLSFAADSHRFSHMSCRLRSEEGEYILGSEQEWADIGEDNSLKGWMELIGPGESQSYELKWDGPEKEDMVCKLELKIEVEIIGKTQESMQKNDDSVKDTMHTIHLWAPVSAKMGPGVMAVNLLYALTACVVGIGVWNMYSDHNKKYIHIKNRKKEEERR